MKRVVLHFIMLIYMLLGMCVSAQVITGTVYDGTTGAPVMNVNVYLDGTTYFAVTNDSGVFKLNVGKMINAPLVFSHVAYEILRIEKPFEKDLREIYLDEKVNELEEVVIKTGLFSRGEKMKAFEQQFLGDSKIGKSCVIANKDDIYLYYDGDTKTLYAKCFEPIIVTNDYLGYQMYFSLAEFNIRYMTKTLKKGHIEYVLLRGSVFFKDIAPLNPVIKKRRNEIYKGSLNYFFKSLANNSLASSRHVIYNHRNKMQMNDLQQAVPSQYFDITDNGAGKNVCIKSNSGINTVTFNTYKFPLPITGVITVADPSGGFSEIIFLTDEFTVDAFGNTDKKDYIYVTGHMSNQRAGSMVPLDNEF